MFFVSIRNLLFLVHLSCSNGSHNMQKLTISYTNKKIKAHSILHDTFIDKFQKDNKQYPYFKKLYSGRKNEGNNQRPTTTLILIFIIQKRKNN